MKIEEDLPAPCAPAVSSAGLSFGDLPLAPKAIGLCFFRTVPFRCLRLVRQAPSLSSAILQRLRADVRLRGQGGPLRMEEAGRVFGASEGSASEAADAGTCRFRQALTRGVTTLRGWRGRPSRQKPIGRGRERAPRGSSTHRLRSEELPLRSSLSEGRCGRPWSEGSPEARNFGCKL